jgi:hypothetical protein
VNIAVRHRERVDASLLMPRVDWRNSRNDLRAAKSVTVAAAAD